MVPLLGASTYTSYTNYSRSNVYYNHTSFKMRFNFNISPVATGKRRIDFCRISTSKIKHFQVLELMWLDRILPLTIPNDCNIQLDVITEVAVVGGTQCHYLCVCLDSTTHKVTIMKLQNQRIK